MLKINPVFKKTSVLLLLLFFFSGCDFGWKQYAGEDHGFSMLLPVSWEKEEGVLNTTLAVLAPVKDKNNGLPVRANMNVIVVDLPRMADLNIVFDFNKIELASKLARIDDAKEGDIYAGLLPGKWFSLEGLLSGSRVKIISANWVKGKRVYTVTCTAALDEFPKYEPVFQKMFDSLRIE